jgi:hypothetical protein
MGRKTMLPMPTESRSGGVGLRLIGGLAGLVLFALLLHDPIGAAGTVERIAAWFGAAIESLARFGEALSS